MSNKRRSGLTLVELVVVLVILVALAGLAIEMLSGTTQDASQTATLANLQNLGTVIGRYRMDNSGQLPYPGPLGQSGYNAGGTSYPPRPYYPQLRYLFVNPATETAATSYNPFTRLGWNGPYVLGGIGEYPNPSGTSGTYPKPNTAIPNFTSNFGTGTLTSTGKWVGDQCVLDAWLNPIVLVQFTDANNVSHAWLQSAGPDGLLAVAYPSSGGGVNVTYKNAAGTFVTTAITGAPVPVTPSSATPSNPVSVSGSQFPTSSGYVAVDDLTYVVQ